MSLVRGKMVFWNFLLDFEKYGKNLFVSFFVLFLFFVLWHQNFQSFGYIFSYFRKDVFIKTIDCRKKSLKEIPQDLSREKTFEDNSITNKKERAKIFGQYDHVRVYGKDYFNKLRSIGFKVDEIDYTQKIAPEKLERFCLMKGEILPVCYKN